MNDLRNNLRLKALRLRAIWYLILNRPVAWKMSVDAAGGTGLTIPGNAKAIVAHCSFTGLTTAVRVGNPDA